MFRGSGQGFIAGVLKILLPVFLILTALPVAPAHAGSADGITGDNEKSGLPDYVIEPGDVLYISVWDEDDLREDVTVRPDGKISFPLAGDVPAACLTFSMLREELTGRLRQYVRDPIISISLKKTGGKKVIVLGEVREPGVYSVTGKSTVLEAIALANGFTQHAVLSSVIVVRGGSENPEGMRLDLGHAIKKTDMSQNIVLQSEDMVYVPRRFIADVNYFIAQFLEPVYKSAWTLRLMQLIGQ